MNYRDEVEEKYWKEINKINNKELPINSSYWGEKIEKKGMLPCCPKCKGQMKREDLWLIITDYCISCGWSTWS